MNDNILDKIIDLRINLDENNIIKILNNLSDEEKMYENIRIKKILLNISDTLSYDEFIEKSNLIRISQKEIHKMEILISNIKSKYILNNIIK